MNTVNNTPEKINSGELLTEGRQPSLSEYTITALDELYTCMDLVEDILSRGFGVDPGPRPGREVKTLVDAAENIVECVSFLHSKISLLLTLMLANI